MFAISVTKFVITDKTLGIPATMPSAIPTTSPGTADSILPSIGIRLSKTNVNTLSVNACNFGPISSPSAIDPIKF